MVINPDQFEYILPNSSLWMIEKLTVSKEKGQQGCYPLQYDH